MPAFCSILSELLQVLQAVVNLAGCINSLLTDCMVEQLLDKRSLLLKQGQLHTGTNSTGTGLSTLAGLILSLVLHWKLAACFRMSRALEVFRKCCMMMNSFNLDMQYSGQIACWLSKLLQQDMKLIDSVLQEEDSFTVNAVREFLLISQQQQGLQDLSDVAIALLRMLTESLLNGELNYEMLSPKCHRVKQLAESANYKTLLGETTIEDKGKRSIETLTVFSHYYHNGSG